MSTLLDPDFLRALERLTLLVRRRVRSRSGGDRPSALFGRGVEFADYRSYQVGDDYRFVDWNAYARLDRLFVKLTTTEEDLDVHLVLDASASMGFASPTKLDYARRLAAALGYLSLVNLDRVGAVVLQGRHFQVLPPRRGRRYAHTLFSFLEQVRAEGPTDLAGALSDYMVPTRRRGVAILLTDLLDPAGYEAALERLHYGRFETFLIQILSEEELVPPFQGELRLVDAETGSALEWTSSREAVEAFARARDRFLEECRHFCFRHGIEYIRTTTRVPLQDLVLRYLRAAGLVRG